MTAATPMMLTEGMKPVSLPYIKEYTDRQGRRRRYVRRHGREIALKLDPTAAGYLEEYQKALKGLEPETSKPAAGTWHALVTEYLGSSQFKRLKPRTQEENRREAERIREKWGKHPVDRLEPRHILKWQDQLAETPGKANNMLATLKMLLAFGKPRGYRHPDPAAGIPELKAGSYRSWTDGEIKAFEEAWPLGTMERLIFDLALYTGQRRGDLIAMTRHHIDNEVMGVAQEKTGERVAIPVHAALRASIAAYKAKGLSILQRKDGQPFKVRELSDVIAAAIDGAKLPRECVLHGLRYASARRLSEAGATPHEIMAVTGHRTLGMVEKYTRDANKKKLAGSAMVKLKLWGARTEQEGV